jgi:hypothetical protein
MRIRIMRFLLFTISLTVVFAGAYNFFSHQMGIWNSCLDLFAIIVGSIFAIKNFSAIFKGV